MLFTLIVIFDPKIPLSSAFTYDMWIVGPVLISIGLFFTGRGLYSLYRGGHSLRVVWIITWAIFSTMLFLALWIGFILLTSVGASETPTHIFLSFTARFAAGFGLLSQVLVMPWLFFIFRNLLGFSKFF
jgi:hypothetical protein